MDQWMKRYRIFSRTMLGIAMLMLWWVTEWSMKFAATSSLSGTEIAAVIAVVQVPATALFASVYKSYAENKLP